MSSRRGVSQSSIKGLDFSLFAEKEDCMSRVCATAKDFAYDKQEIRMITPEHAKKMLRSTGNNVRISDKLVKRYANEIRIGLWNKPKHCVSILKNGEISGGHEFLMGIMEAKTPAKLYFGYERASSGSRDHDNNEHEIRLVTPDMARMLLSTSESSVSVSKNKVAEYAKEILSNNRNKAPYEIKLSLDGELLSGHEYLYATIKAGVPVKFAYVPGCRERAPVEAVVAPVAAPEESPSLPEHLANTTTQWEYVTPEIAKEYLDLNRSNVRPINESVVEKYSRDLIDGRWGSNHQGIAFYEDGDVADGQHRLKSIANTGISVWMMVTRGLRRESGVSIDIGKVRDYKTQAGIMGLDIQRRHSAIAKAMMIFHFDNSTPDREVIDFISTYLESMDFALGAAKSSPANHSVIHAVLARAHYCRPEDRGEIERFARILLTGLPEMQGDESAIILRNHFVNTNRTIKSGWRHGEPRKALYRRVQYCLMAFLERRKITKCWESDQEMFPLKGGI